MSKYSVPDDHWESREERELAESPARVDTHSVEVILTTDPTEKYGYGREKYTVHIVHDGEDAPYALYATEHRWKGNFWRDVKDIDWHDVPGTVRKQVACVVACNGVNDLHPGHRVIGEGGESRWKRRQEAGTDE